MVYDPVMLAVLALLLVADPGPALGPPRLPAGVERLFRGEAEEVGRGVDNPFRKRHELEVRFVVLAAHAGGSDLGVLTRVWPLSDPVVAGPAAALTGTGPPVRGDPSVRFDLIRVDPRGRVGRLPTAVGPGVAASPIAEGPPDRLPPVETGLFVPLPPRPVRAGDAWPDADTLPPTAWAVAGEVAWNGVAAAEVSAVRQTAGFDSPDKVLVGWKRSDTLAVPPADGFAVRLDRQVRRREGGSVVGELRLTLAQKSAGRRGGGLLEDAKLEAEAACRFAAELAPLVAQGARADPKQVRARLARVQRYLDERPVGGPFRDAIEAVRVGGEALLKR